MTFGQLYTFQLNLSRRVIKQAIRFKLLLVHIVEKKAINVIYNIAEDGGVGWWVGGKDSKK